MFSRVSLFAAAAVSLALLAPTGSASAADLPVKAKPVADLPFFLLIDDRVTFSYIFSGTDPNQFSRNPNGTINGKTEKQVYSFTHFDIWGLGTNFFTISMFKSGHNDPASPCTSPGTITDPFTGFTNHPTARVRPKSTACSDRPSAGTRSSIPRPSPWGRCITFRSKSAWMPTPKMTSTLRPSVMS
jgi:hypothetical protein